MKGLHHVSLKARGEEAFEHVLAFYSQVLDCPLIRRWGEGESQGAMLDLGNTILEVSASGTETGKGLFAHIAFAVDDVDGVIQRMREVGRPILVEPTDKNLGGSYPIRIAFCQGPIGEELEFFHEYS